jgi:uncharacterized membrane protein YeaQ/YmgE (transglycosylase-associated protein family)
MDFGPYFGPYTPYVVLAIVGLIAGWLSGLLLGGGGLIRNLIVGVMGAYVGAYLVRMLNLNIGLGSPWLDQIAIATMGAIVVTILARIIAR